MAKNTPFRYGVQSQRQLAKILGVGYPWLNNVLKGKGKPSRKLAIKLEHYTGICQRHWLYPKLYDKEGNPIQ